jgi:hypothetical protein
MSDYLVQSPRRCDDPAFSTPAEQTTARKARAGKDRSTAQVAAAAVDLHRGRLILHRPTTWSFVANIVAGVRRDHDR